MADYLRQEASFAQTTEAVRAFTQRLEEQLAIYEKEGDQLRATQTRARIRALQGPSTAAEVQRATEAIDQQAAAQKRVANLETGTLETIRQQTAALQEQAALRARLQAPSIILPPERRYGTSATQGQILAEEEAARIAAVRRQVRKDLGAGIDPAQWAALKASQIVIPPQTRGFADPGQLAGAQEAQARAEEAQARAARLAAERAAEEARVRAELEREIALQEHLTALQREGFLNVARSGRLVPRGAGGELPAALQPPPGLAAGWTAADEAAARYNLTLGEAAAYERRAGLSAAELNASFTRLGLAESEASNELRRHGALTTEFLTALARGETTLSEFGYQLGATIGKFSGWAVAAGATYAAFGAVYEFGKGAIDAASGAQQLTRTIDGLDQTRAVQALQALSAATNVPISEASDAVFRYSRTFHDLNDAVAAAHLGLAVFKLDQVDIADSVRLSTAINQQYGGGIATLQNLYNELALGQREFNARMSETIPLVQRSSGAVKNAGGDLTQLAQLGIYAQRITQLGGAQIGTAFYRSAATFLSPTTTKGQADRGVLEELGINPNQGWTQVLRDALVRSVTLGPEDRGRLSNAIFGPQFGGRLSAIFNPAGVATYQQIAQRATPQGARGSLDEELKKELSTARERMHSFVNEIQRIGAAVGASGIVNNLTALLSVIVSLGGPVRSMVEAFDRLPSSFRTVIEAALALRAAQLFVSRTRFGSTIPGLNQLPGFRPSEATIARRDLALGTRQAMNQLENDIAQSSARSLTNVAKQATLEQQRAVIEEEIRRDGETEALKASSNAINERIVALQREQVLIEEERNAQLAALKDLKEQQVGLTSISRNTRTDDAGVIALRNQVNASTAAGEGAIAGGAAADAALSADTAAQSRLAAVKGQLASFLRANAASEEELAAALGSEGIAAAASTTATITARTAAGVATAGFGRIAAGIGGIAAAMDPLTIGLVALPFALSALNDAANKASQADDAAKSALNESANDLTQLNKKIHNLRDAAKKEADASKPFVNIPVVSDLIGTVESFFGFDTSGDKGTSQAAGALDRYAQAFNTMLKKVESDALWLRRTQQQRDEFYARINQYKDAARTLVGADQSPAAREALNAFFHSIEERVATYKQSLTALNIGGSDPFAQFRQLDLSTNVKNLQAQAEVAKVYGATDDQLKEMAYAYEYLSSAYAHGHSSDAARLVEQAQTAYVDTVRQGVQDLIDQANAITVPSVKAAGEAAHANALKQRVALLQRASSLLHGYEGDLSSAYDALATANKAAVDALSGAEKKLETIQQNINSIGDLTSSVAAPLTSAINGLLGSITGTKIAAPVDPLQQAQGAVQSARGAARQAQQQLQAAGRARSGAQAQLAPLGNQIAQAQNSAENQGAAGSSAADEARALIEAQGRLAQSAITGITPADDIKRAQAAVVAARNLLAYDQQHGAKESEILTDQAAVDDAIRALNQQLQERSQQQRQDLAAFIDAESKLQQSETLDPVKQAREQLKADIKVLKTIRPEDYKTYQEYQTAVLGQRAKINDDRQKANQAVIDQDLSTLRFEHDTQKIGDQQYIQGLEAILRAKKLSLAERQQILGEIYNIQKQTAGDLNLGSIRIPTAYEIRRATLAAQGGIQVTNHYSTDIQVTDERAATKVGVAMDRYHRGVGKSIERAMGYR